MPLYFSYGANMDPGHMAGRAPGAERIGPARLRGFRLAFNVYSTEWRGGAANLEPDPERSTWGVLWSVPASEVASLAAFRGHPTFYRREDVAVDGPSGTVIAWTYRVAHQERAYVRPTDAYLELLRGAIASAGLPPAALEELERAARPPRPQIST